MVKEKKSYRPGFNLPEKGCGYRVSRNMYKWGGISGFFIVNNSIKLGRFVFIENRAA